MKHSYESVRLATTCSLYKKKKTIFYVGACFPGVFMNGIQTKVNLIFPYFIFIFFAICVCVSTQLDIKKQKIKLLSLNQETEPYSKI